VTNKTKQKAQVSVTYIPLVQQALEALQSLNPVERAVLGLRFGLDDGQERDLDAVARQYGVSTEIIRCVEIDALRKLRHHDCYRQTAKKRRVRSARAVSKAHLYVVQP
jgi:DNA-directed RNA polymerase sigma subunit (sigma70/sigma32)